MNEANSSKVPSQIVVFFQSIWNSEKGEARTQTAKLLAGKVTPDEITKTLFKNDGEEEFLSFLQLLAEKDQSAVWLIVNVGRHDIDVSSAVRDARDLVLHYGRSKLS